LSPEEQDKFGQQLVALSLTRALSPSTTLSSVAYRHSASGGYDYFFLPDRYRFELEHAWYGVTSTLSTTRGALALAGGINANTYDRDHRAFLRPDLATSLYDNTGHKDDASAFAKATLTRGRVAWFGDVQARWARFGYTPDPRAGIDARAIDWAFVNPRAGVRVALPGAWSAYVSYGLTTREPTRSDLFAGEDDLNAGNVAALGDFARVRPERVANLESGVRWAARGSAFEANVYSMDFRDDIARIGAPTASGSVLRRNVGASYRRGLEVDARWQAHPRVALTTNGAWSTNRIRRFTDSSRGTPIVRENVEPLLTPRLLTTHAVEFMPAVGTTLRAEGRYQSRAFLDNTSSPDRVLPDFYVADLSAARTWRRWEASVRVFNIGNTQKFGSGSVDSDGTARYFVLPARAWHVTLTTTF
jgi:iron complex outermembrane receptor protein